MMKKMIMALCIFICAFTLVACSGQQTNEPLTLGVNAIITEIDKENKIITTKDSGEEGVLGDDCLIDCSQIPMIYCNYDTQNVVAITLDDLQVGDEIILTIRSSEIENLQKEKGDLLIQIKSAKEKLDTLEIAKKDIQDQTDVLTKELQNDSDRLVDIECQLKKYEGKDVEVDVSKENSIVDTNVILDEVHEEQPEKEAIPLIPALEEENVVVEEEKSVFEQALEATVQQTQKDDTHYKYPVSYTHLTLPTT